MPHYVAAGRFPKAAQEVEVNSTARWPERLEQVATLLRAEGAAILALQDGDVRTLFSCRIDDALAWRLVLGDDAVDRAVTDRGAFATAIPAERWGDAVAYALLVPIISTSGERGVLCAMRHGIPFDAVEVIAGEAAARLLAMAFSDAQAVAIAERDTSPALAPAERALSTERAPTLDRPPAAERPAAGPPPLRVAIVESHPATRIGLETILASAGVTVGVSSATLAEALSRMPGNRCDVALVGAVADSSTAEAVHRLRTRARLEVIVIADERRGSDAHAALRTGAVGLLARDAAPVRIVAALHAAAAGLAAVDAGALEALLRASSTEAAPTRSVETISQERRATDRPLENGDRSTDALGAERSDRPADALSPREMELLRYLAEGYTNKEIARVMVLAEDTVKKGVQSLIAKLGAADRTHAVVLALRSGLIE